MRVAENTMSTLEAMLSKSQQPKSFVHPVNERKKQKVSKAKKTKDDQELPSWLTGIINSPAIVAFKIKNANASDPCPHEIALHTLFKNNDHYFGKQEHYLQVALFYKTKLLYPDLYEMMFACPNGGMRSRGVAGQMKAEGQKKGYPDIGVDIPAGEFHGLRLEVKTDKGRPHEHQLDWQDKLRRHGYKSEVGRGFDECWSIISEYAELYLTSKASK